MPFKENAMKKSCSGIWVALIVVVLRFPLVSQALDDHLKFLEPLLGTTWTAQMKLPPDGGKTAAVTMRCEALWSGKVVRFTRTVAGLDFFREGYFYWDGDEKKVLLFTVDNRGGADRGVVTQTAGQITVSGTMVMGDKKYEYRNTFEFPAPGQLIDRWFQNARGPWQPGHVIEFSRGN
jgi:hypothetical protein